MMRRECLKLAQQAALALCANNDPTEYFNALSNTLDRIEGDKPMWTAVYEAYLSLHGVGNREQDVAHARTLINKALEAYNTPVYLEQFEMLILAVVLIHYKKVAPMISFAHMQNFFSDQAAKEFEEHGIRILNAVLGAPVNNICSYLAHRKLTELYSQIIFGYPRNPMLAQLHSIAAQDLFVTLTAPTSYAYGGDGSTTYS